MDGFECGEIVVWVCVSGLGMGFPSSWYDDCGFGCCELVTIAPCGVGII